MREDRDGLRPGRGPGDARNRSGYAGGTGRGDMGRGGNGSARRHRGAGARRSVSGGAVSAAEVPAENGRARRMRYIPALDGLRTLAVIAVVLYHLNLPWAQGGLLGVTMFFVLSGYLITRLLVAEFDQDSSIDLKGFWMRRVRRLVPATIAVVVVTAVLCTIFNHVMLTKMRPDIVPSLLFFNNWWQIIHQVSYFNAIGDPSPLTHFWSLAIEEQFYLVWPPILLIMLKLGTKHRVARRVALALAAVSAVAMIVLYDPGADPSRVYYGTDTRAFSLLLGAWLAFIPEGSMRPSRLVQVLGLTRLLPGGGERPRNADMNDAELAAINGAAPSSYASIATGTSADKPDRPTKRTTQGAGSESAASGSEGTWSLDLIGLIGIAGLVLMTIFTNGYTSFQYRGGTLLCSVLTLAVIAACVQPEGILSRVLSLPPLVWLGTRSYSIYLWHYPLLLLMNPVSDITAKPWWAYVVQALVVVAVAEMSYRFIETPFRRGAFGAWLSRVRDGRQGLVAALGNPIPAATALVLVAVALGGLAFVPDTSALSEEGAEALNAQEETAPADEGTADGGGTTEGGVAMNEDGFPEGSYDVLMVGDSVSLRAVDSFDSIFPHSHIDAAKNRQFTAGEGVYESYVQQNLAGKIAVFALGTNGLVTDDAIDSLMADVGSQRIAVFVNTRSPQPWVGETNAAIARAAERYDNVRVIDWYGYSANRNDLFDGDGTHLSQKGVDEYLDLIYQEVKDDLPFHPEDHANDPEIVTAREAIEAAANAIFTIDTDPLNPPEDGSQA